MKRSTRVGWGILTMAMVLSLTVAVSAQDKTRLVVNITTDNPLRVMQALDLALENMEAGSPVSIHLSQEGVRFGSRYAFFGEGPSPGRKAQRVIYQLIREGAEVTVCPLSAGHFKLRGNELIYAVEFAETDMLEDKLKAGRFRMVND